MLAQLQNNRNYYMLRVEVYVGTITLESNLTILSEVGMSIHYKPKIMLLNTLSKQNTTLSHCVQKVCTRIHTESLFLIVKMKTLIVHQ